MSNRKDKYGWAIIVLILLAVAVAGLYILWPQLQAHATVRVGDGVFTAKVAKTEAERDKGLGGTNELRETEAMLFVFDTEDKWPIWMKDMAYPIDIVWLDRDKQVVYIVKNAPPESYPYEKFKPKQDAKYVLEFQAGTATKKSINIGQTVFFDENHIEGLFK